MDATQFYITRLINQLLTDCSSAQARIRAATTMRAVRFAASLHPSAMIRSLPEVRQELRRVHDCAETRLAALLGQQLKTLEACQSSEHLRQAYGHLVRNDWIFLRGDFSRLYGRADREYHRMLLKQVQHEKEAAAAPPLEIEPDDQDSSAPAP